MEFSNYKTAEIGKTKINDTRFFRKVDAPALHLCVRCSPGYEHHYIVLKIHHHGGERISLEVIENDRDGIHEAVRHHDDVVKEIQRGLFIINRKYYPKTEQEFQDAIERAKSRLSENRYNVVTNNCEHYANYVMKNVEESTQKENFIKKTTQIVIKSSAPYAGTILSQNKSVGLETDESSKIATEDTSETTNRKVKVNDTEKQKIDENGKSERPSEKKSFSNADETDERTAETSKSESKSSTLEKDSKLSESGSTMTEKVQMNSSCSKVDTKKKIGKEPETPGKSNSSCEKLNQSTQGTEHKMQTCHPENGLKTPRSNGIANKNINQCRNSFAPGENFDLHSTFSEVNHHPSLSSGGDFSFAVPDVNTINTMFSVCVSAAKGYKVANEVLKSATDVTKNFVSDAAMNASSDATKNVAINATEKVASDAAKKATSYVAQNAQNAVRDTAKKATTTAAKKIANGTTKKVVSNTANGTIKKVVSNTSKMAGKDSDKKVGNGAAKTTVSKTSKDVGAAVVVAVEGAIVCYSLYELRKRLENGEINEEEYKLETKRLFIQETASVAGGMIGQTLIPVPVLGAVVGGCIGGIIGNWLSP